MRKMMIALLTAATLWGCGKDNPGDDPPGPNSGTKGVYIAGWAASGDDEVAILWKDGQATKLTPTPLKKARALSVCVSGNDVYVGGYERRVAGSYETAVLWKNGVSTALSDNTYPYSRVYSIAVSGNDVYAAGMRYKAGGKQLPYCGKTARRQI